MDIIINLWFIILLGLETFSQIVYQGPDGFVS